MTDTAAPAAAPAAPSAAPAPETSRGRASNFERGMEAKNAAAAQRAQQRQQQPAERAPALQQLRQQSPERQQRDANEQAKQEVPLEQQLLGGPEEQPELEQPVEEPQLAEEGLEQPALPPDQQALMEAVREFQETGALPEAFMDATLEFTDANGIVRQEKIRDLKENGMRLSEFHRNLGFMRQREQQMAERDQNVRNHFERIRDPQVFLDEYEERGYGDVIERAVDLKIKQRQARKQVVEAAGYRVMQQFQCAGNDPRVIEAMRLADGQLTQAQQVIIENRRIKRENELLSRQAQAQQANVQAQASMQTLAKSFEQLVPMAMKAMRLYESDTNRAKILEHLGAYVRNLPNWDGTYRREHVLAAARIRREELEFERAQANGQAKPKPKQKPVSRALPPSASTGASRSGSAQPVSGGRKRPSDMATDPKFGGMF